jgi:hypothetical protein
MQTKDQQFNVQELFDSLSPEEQDRINLSVEENTKSRDLARYTQLQAAEIAKSALIQELDQIEHETAENDNWFIAAKEHKVNVTNDALNRHRRIAEELYSRKRAIIGRWLPEAESNIQAVISQIETQEDQEPLFKMKDLERLLRPFYEERERARRQVIVAQAKERMRRWEEEEARKQEEYEALLDRMRAEALERKRLIAEKQRKQRAESIRARVHERKIPYLVHFTPIANVESILEYGLRSRNALAGHKYVFTDEYRSDGWLDWISLSVSFPNYKMFYAKKNSLNDVDGWAVLVIRREVLWELDCKFILTNAASFGIRMFRDDKWSSVEAFEGMFNHAEHRNGIPDFFTTDPQAEVMVRNEVPRDYVNMIAVERHIDAERVRSLSDVQVDTIPELFRWRSDFEHWRKFRLSPFVCDSKPIELF